MGESPGVSQHALFGKPPVCASVGKGCCFCDLTLDEFADGWLYGVQLSKPFSHILTEHVRSIEAADCLRANRASAPAETSSSIGHVVTDPKHHNVQVTARQGQASCLRAEEHSA